MMRLLFIVLTFGILSCGQQNSGDVVARVYDVYLYQSDIDLPATSNSQDSAQHANIFVDNWVKEQVILHQASINVAGEESKYEKRLESYRNKLVIYDYENELIKQKLKTTVSEEEARNYYNEYGESFVLNEDRILLKYAVFKEGIDGLRNFGSWMRGENRDEEILNFARDKALQYDVDGEIWYKVARFEGILPSSKSQLQSLVKAKDYKYVKKDGKEYFMRFINYLSKGEQSPFELVQKQIEVTLINNRKMELLKTMKEDLYRESVVKEEIEIFKK